MQTHNKNQFQENLNFALMLGLLLFAPWVASGKSIYALLVLELAALALLASLFWNLFIPKRLPMIVWLSLGLLALIPLLYLISFNSPLWQELPHPDHYQAAVTWLQQQDSKYKAWLAPSIVPQKTLHALLALLPLLAIFIAASSTPVRKLTGAIYALLILASIQAIWGILQYTMGLEQLYVWGSKHSGGNARATYLNRDHYVALMYLLLPLSIGLFSLNIGKYTQIKESDNKTKFDRWLIKTLLLALATFLLLIAALFSRSRAGIFLMILAIFMSALLFARHVGGKRSAGLTTTVTMLAFGMASSVGLIPVVNRFIAINPMEDFRWEMAATAIVGIKAFFPLGSGPGTFQEIYRTVQPYDQRHFINHAHNDYLELLFEIGAVGILVLALLLILYIYGWFSLRGMRWHEIRFIKVGAGISLFLMMLHSLVDFNMHTPANALIVAFLAGVFLAKIPEDELQRSHRRRRRLHSKSHSQKAEEPL